MATLRELLEEHLPKVLSADPAQSKSGTELIKGLLKQNNKAFKGYSVAALRQYFSAMSKDPTSCIARVSDGYGYYKRPSPGARPDTGRSQGRGGQPEEKLRVLYMRWMTEQGAYAMPIEHTKGTKGPAGGNLWKYPDVVVVRWLIEVEETSQAFETHSLQLRRSLGERLFRLNSVELKVAASMADARSIFFQCLSNSRWAHTASLVIGERISDARVEAELARLGASYGVEVLSLGLEQGLLSKFSPASQIAAMSDDDFAKKFGDAPVPRVLSPGDDRAEIDWSYLADIRPQNRDFDRLLGWLSFCVSNSRPFPFSGYLAATKDGVA